MERDSRRNSILKSVSITYSTLDCEDESREYFRLQQKSLKKRVSFAGRDEIKEFKKTDTLLSVATIASNLCDAETEFGQTSIENKFSSSSVQEVATITTTHTTFFSENEGKENKVPVVHGEALVPEEISEPPEKKPHVPPVPVNSDNTSMCITSNRILNSQFVQNLSASWKVSFIEQRKTLTCDNKFLSLSFKLGKEFLYGGKEHFIIDDIDVDHTKETSNVWARFGFSLLENTLENLFKKLPEPSTVDLKDFLAEAALHYQAFSEFLSIDVVGLELLADPRSLKLDTELHKISFDVSNLENVKMVHADLFLRGVYPISLSEVKLLNKIGSININEATTMLMNIRPCTSFLTKVAQCLSDLLKFKPCI